MYGGGVLNVFDQMSERDVSEVSGGGDNEKRVTSLPKTEGVLALR